MQSTLSMRGVSKSFGHVQALIDVNLDLVAGEIVGLLGDNGAGKSTLIKIISGVYFPDEGQFTRSGDTVAIENPTDARNLGIATVYQDLELVDTRPVAHNIYLGREARRWRFFLNRRKMEENATALLKRLNIELPSVKVNAEILSGGQRQAVAISRAIAQGGDILLLDEPTAALGVEQTAQVHQLVRSMKDDGKTLVLITHDLSEVLNVVDRVVVLRQGRLYADSRASETDLNELVGWITGAAPPKLPEAGSLT